MFNHLVCVRRRTEANNIFVLVFAFVCSHDVSKPHLCSEYIEASLYVQFVSQSFLLNLVATSRLGNFSQSSLPAVYNINDFADTRYTETERERVRIVETLEESRLWGCTLAQCMRLYIDRQFTAETNL